jgi:ABC-2 type transport system ATP-binding protein
MDVSAIRTVGLTKRFGRITALDDLSIDVAAGEVFGFLGPNGAGKTTTVRALLGLARPTAGRCEILGHDVWRDRRAALARVAHVPGEFSCWPQLRGGEMLDLLGALHGGADPARRTHWCERFEFDPTKRGREYSKGNRQKIALIAALMVDADVLVLDEPTSGLDPLMEQAFRDAVREASARGVTVFLSSHLLSEVEAVCDRVAILRAGKLIDVGTLDQLRSIDARVVRVVFDGVPPVLDDVPGVAGVVAIGNEVHLHLRGEPAPLLSVLAAHRVTSLDIREPSLEEVFLTFYGDGDRR